LVIASLYFKRLTARGALAGVVVGGLVGALWIMLGSEISAALPGFVAGFATIWAVSLFDLKTIPNIPPER
jgi:Na+/proline symporter